MTKKLHNNKDDKKDKKSDLKKYNLDDSDKKESLADKEQKTEHSGKLDKVPFNAVAAYIKKYQGVGRFSERYHKGDEKINLEDNKKNKKQRKMSSHSSESESDDDAKQGKGIPYQKYIASSDDVIDTQPIRVGGRRSDIFYPLDSDDDVKQDFELEEIEMPHAHPDNYASEFSNLLNRKFDPQVESFDNLINLGNVKLDLLGKLLITAARSKDALINKKALKLFKSRLTQLKVAQDNAMQQTEDLQPGIFIYDESLAFYLENVQEQDNWNIAQYEEFMRTALTKEKYFKAFIDATLSALERNIMFDFSFAKQFAHFFAEHMINMVAADSIDFVLHVLKKVKSTIRPVSNFIKILRTYAKNKSILITRQFTYQNATGTVCVYQDVNVNQVLKASHDYGFAVDMLINHLAQHASSVKIGQGMVSSLKGKGIESLTHIRNKLTINNKIRNYEGKFGAGRAQEMAMQPSEHELMALQADVIAKSICRNDSRLGGILCLVLDALELFKVRCEGADFVNMVPVYEFETLVRMMLAHTHYSGSSGEPVDISTPFTGKDIWLAEAQKMFDGSLNFDVNQKLILVQGYIGAMRVAERRAEIILENQLRRIGIDPLAPLIVTAELSNVLKELGYYVEENVGLSQAMDQLKLKATKTLQMECDLEKMYANLDKAAPPISAINALVDTIIGNFCGVNSARPDRGEATIEQLRLYVCPNCNQQYGMDETRLPITLGCGDTQCLRCSVDLKECYVCKYHETNLPENVTAYNPTMHCPVNYLHMCKINGSNAQVYMANYLISNRVVLDTPTSNQISNIMYMNQIMTELYMCRGTAGKSQSDKNVDFILNLKQCTTPYMFLKTVLGMLTTEAHQDLIQLVQLALLLSEFYPEGTETRAMLANIVVAIVTAARIPMQSLATQALLDHNITAVLTYCSGTNIAMIEELLKTKYLFMTSSHCFNYAESAPLALSAVNYAIECLESEDFDDAIPGQLRIDLVQQFQELQVKLANYIEAQNYTLIDHEIKNMMSIFYNEFSIYLRGIEQMNESARHKVTMLFNYFNNDILQQVNKKYSSGKFIECDPTLIDLKYSEVMLSDIKERLQGMYDFTINNAKEAIRKQKEEALIQKNAGLVQLARQKLIYPGILFDIPTSNSAYKGIPPLILAVSQDSLGNNPMLPLYQYSVSEGTLYDNPYEGVFVPEMELAHTEGRLFYTGYDGFLEEYTPQALDPMVRDVEGRILLPDTILNLTNGMQVAAANVPPLVQANAGAPNFVNQMRQMLERSSMLKQYQSGYFGTLANSILDTPAIKNIINSMPYGWAAEQGIRGFANLLSPMMSNFSGQAAEWLNTQNINVGNTGTMYRGRGVDKKKKKKPIGYETIDFEDSDDDSESLSSLYAKKRNLIGGQIKKHIINRSADFDLINLIRPIFKTLHGGAIRKQIQDVYDKNTNKFNIQPDYERIIEQSPKCGHCSSSFNLRATCYDEPEVLCGGCLEGKGITRSRKLASLNNTKELHISDFPAHHELSKRYNDFITMHTNLSGSGRDNDQEMVDEDGYESDDTVYSDSESSPYKHVNPDWQRLRKQARPYFTKDPDRIIEDYKIQKIRTPLHGAGLETNLKHAALLGGKLMSLRSLEKKAMPEKSYDRLKHNFLMRAHAVYGQGRHLERSTEPIDKAYLRPNESFEDLAARLTPEHETLAALATTLV